MTGAVVRERRTPPEGLGQLLRGARERAGLGVRETARLATLSSGYVSDLEANRRRPSRTVANRLADVLGLDDDGRAQVLAASVDDAGRDHPARPVGNHGRDGRG
ncbi:helix-turn-helix domain-containing protein [Streptomyces sp. B21-101]|uniref:helix-turn-helix domain-containing protein n=1 Tax=Streptomyces sp. B21-101 TaxID=3039415 RepID=UPI002FF15C18